MYRRLGFGWSATSTSDRRRPSDNTPMKPAPTAPFVREARHARPYPTGAPGLLTSRWPPRSPDRDPRGMRAADRPASAAPRLASVSAKTVLEKHFTAVNKGDPYSATSVTFHNQYYAVPSRQRFLGVKGQNNHSYRLCQCFSLRRPPPDGRPEHRAAYADLFVAAHERLWALLHPEARDV